MTAEYCTPLEVNEYLEWDIEVPNYPEETTLETVDDSGSLVSGSLIFLDHGKVIQDTLTLYYGADVDNVTALIVTTHYTFDESTAKITLTAAGATLIGTDNVYAKYKYNEYKKNSVILDLIRGMSNYMDSELDSINTTPELVEKEENVGKGAYNRIYRSRCLPVKVIKMTLTTTVTASETSFVVSDTTGLEVGDYVVIENEVIKIDSVDSVTELTVIRGQYGSTAVAHNSGLWMINYVVEISNSPIGFTPTWKLLKYRSQYDVDSDTGAVQLLHITAEERDDLGFEVYPLPSVFNRIRFTYKKGITSIPQDITNLCVLFVVREIMNSIIAKAHSGGINGFVPSTQERVDVSIERIMREHRKLLASYS